MHVSTYEPPIPGPPPKCKDKVGSFSFGSRVIHVSKDPTNGASGLTRSKSDATNGAVRASRLERSGRLGASLAAPPLERQPRRSRAAGAQAVRAAADPHRKQVHGGPGRLIGPWITRGGGIARRFLYLMDPNHPNDPTDFDSFRGSSG